MTKQSIAVEGIVSRRDKQPYIKLFKDGSPIAQLSITEARSYAHDILTICARTEADAVIHKFFEAERIGEDRTAMVMLMFREFRLRLDSEEVEKYHEKPSGDPPVN